MTKKRISIKFCGGCNPRINRGRLAQKISAELTALGYETVYNETTDMDLIICISGCAVSCAQKDCPADTRTVVVAGPTIDLMSVDEEELAGKIMSKVRDSFE